MLIAEYTKLTVSGSPTSDAKPCKKVVNTNMSNELDNLHTWTGYYWPNMSEPHTSHSLAVSVCNPVP